MSANSIGHSHGAARYENPPLRAMGGGLLLEAGAGVIAISSSTWTSPAPSLRTLQPRFENVWSFGSAYLVFAEKPLNRIYILTCLCRFAQKQYGGRPNDCDVITCAVCSSCYLDVCFLVSPLASRWCRWSWFLISSPCMVQEFGRIIFSIDLSVYCNDRMIIGHRYLSLKGCMQKLKSYI